MKMLPSQHWVALVNKTMAEKKCHHAAAWNLTAQTHPDAAILMSAFGRTRQAAVSFFNSLPLPAACRGEFANELAGQTGRGGRTKGGKPGYVHIVMPGADLRRQPAASQFANDTGGECPVAGPQLLALFRLPGGTPQDIFCAAWKGNGQAVSPINFGKAFAGIVDYLQTQKGGTYDAALASAKAAYPDLWSLVQTIAAQPV